MPTPSQEEAKKDETTAEKLELSPAELQYHAAIRRRMSDMRDHRETPYAQFDDMSYSNWDNRNIKADMSYIPPAKNKGDTRIVTGMTREKDNTLLSTALSFNFDGNVIAYNLEDEIIDEVGENIEDLVVKTREMEDYESKRPIYYRSMISRGTTYVMEMWNEVWGYEKELNAEYGKGQVTGVDWNERLVKLYERCESKLLDPKKVFLGSMFEFFIQNQQDLAVVEILPYDTAMGLFATWERWKFVPKILRKTQETDAADSAMFAKDWSMTDLTENQVEFAIYMRKGTNELCIYLNGVPMLPIKTLGKNEKGAWIVSGFPLTCISPSGDYPIAKGDFEPVDGFAISRSQPAKLRVEQDVQDEALKLMILGFKQGRWPAMVNNSGRVLTRQNFMPANITDDIGKEKVFQLVEGGQGLTQSEFSFYQLLKQGMEEKSVTAQYEGQSPDQNQTATQTLENKKQQMLKLGLALDGITRFERDLWYLRIRNFLANGTKASGMEFDKAQNNVKEIFKKFTIEKPNIGKGSKKRKHIEFRSPQEIKQMQEQDPTGDVLHEYEAKQGKHLGMEVRHVYIDAPALRNLKAVWYVIIRANDKKDDTLARMLFVQNIQEAATLFGPESLNVEKLKQRFTAVIGESFDDWFKDQGQLELMAAQQAQQQGMQGSGQGGGQPMKTTSPIQKPGMRTVLQH
jgi:hypothetical protein